MTILCLPPKKATIENATTRAVSAPAGYGWEDSIRDIFAERDRQELDLIGGILADPLRGLAMAERAGVSHSIIDDDGLWLIFATAIICRDSGRLTGGRDGGMTVALAAKIGLVAEGLWDDDDHRPWPHPPIFSPESMEVLLHSWPSAAMVPHFARRLILVNRRINRARRCLRLARQLIDFNSFDSVPVPHNQNSNWKSHLPERGTAERGMEVAA